MGCYGTASSISDVAQLAQRLTTDDYFGNYAPASNGGSDAANSPAPFESPRTGTSRAVPYLGSTNAARQLFANVPPSDFPAFPSWAGSGGAISSTKPPPANSSPALPAPEKQKRSAAPDDPAWTSAQGAPSARAAFQTDSAHPPARGLLGNFPHASVLASAPSPAAFNRSGSGSGPWTAPDFDALARGIGRLVNGAGQIAGNSLNSPAQAASPPRPPWPGPAAPDFPGATAMASQPNPAYFPGSSGSPAADVNRPASPTAGENFPRLVRRTYSRSPSSVFDTGALAVPFVPSDDPNFSGGLPGRLAAVLAGMGQTQAATSPLDEETQGISSARSAPRLARLNGSNSPAPAIAANLPPPEAGRPLGIFSGEPMPPWTNPLPLADLFGKSNASGNSDWFNFLAGIATRRPLGN
jgi:hypothetical protein